MTAATLASAASSAVKVSLGAAARWKGARARAYWFVLGREAEGERASAHHGCKEAPGLGFSKLAQVREGGCCSRVNPAADDVGVALGVARVRASMTCEGACVVRSRKD